jgi:ATP-dependent DNA helicase PIF1
MNSIAQRVILCALNEDTHFINDNILDRMPSVVKEYKSHDEAVSESAEDAHVPTEFLNRLTPSGMPPHVLRLKVGCIAMLLRNLNMNMGLCNVTRLIVTHLHQNIIECRRFNHPDDEPPIAHMRHRIQRKAST